MLICISGYSGDTKKVTEVNVSSKQYSSYIFGIKQYTFTFFMMQNSIKTFVREKL